MTDAVDWEEFRLEIDGVVAITPCFQFECYTWFDDGFGEFYQRARSALGDLISHYQTDGMKRTRVLDARAETIVPTWVKSMRAGKSYWVRFTGCETDRGITPAWIELSFYQTPPFARSSEGAANRSAIYRKMFEESESVPTPFVMMARVTFPVDHQFSDPARALAWILDLKAVNSHPFLSGHAGYALNVNHRFLQPAAAAMQRTLGSLVLRYPGLDYYQPGGQSERVLRYDAERAEFFPVVKRAAWVNLVSDATLERLGGRDNLSRVLGEDLPIKTHDLPHGVAIQAGEAPQLGDVAQRDFLPVYRRVAKALRPVRLESIRRLGSNFDDENAHDWLNAFDKEYD